MPVVTTTRRKATALLIGLGLAGATLTGCDPTPPPTTPPPTTTPAASTITTADIDTFTVSAQPTATRGNDTVLRVMDSDGKLKTGYLSFPVAAADTTSLSATLGISARHSGFALAVHNVGSFTNNTTFTTRPALGSQVGTLASTTAGTRQRIALTGVRASRGRVYLAITTSSPYELEITSTEGATAASAGPRLGIKPGTPPPPPPPSPPPPPPPHTPRSRPPSPSPDHTPTSLPLLLAHGNPQCCSLCAVDG